MVTQSYYWDSSGNLVVVSSEGGQFTYGPANQLISSKTASQVSIEDQLRNANINVDSNISNQIAIGLQQQTREALAGEKPKPFEVAGAIVSTSLTPNILAGASGSVIPRGYMKDEQGRIVLSPQTFKDSSGREFTVTPTGSATAGGFIWSTPYGEVRSTPETLKKNIERTAEVRGLTSQIRQQEETRREETLYIKNLSENPLNRIYYSISHYTEGPSAVLGGLTLAVTGQKPLEKSLKEVSTNYKDWITYQIRGGSKTLLAGQDILNMALPIALIGIMPGGAGSVASWGLKKSIMTGLTEGLGSGLTAIGTFESIKGYQEKSAIRLGGGLITGILGGYTVKSGWPGVQASVYADFPSLRPEPKILEVIKSSAFQKLDSDEYVGIKQSKIIGKIEGKTFLGEAKVNYDAITVNEKMIKGFGKIDANILDLETKQLTGRSGVFGSLGKLDNDLIYSKIIYGESPGINIDFFNSGRLDRELNRAGVSLALQELKNTEQLKKMDALTKVLESFKGLPTKTASLFGGGKTAGFEMTDIYNIGQDLNKFELLDLGGGLKTIKSSKTLSGGLASVTAEIESNIMKDLSKEIVVNVPRSTGKFYGLWTSSSLDVKMPEVTRLKIMDVSLDEIRNLDKMTEFSLSVTPKTRQKNIAVPSSIYNSKFDIGQDVPLKMSELTATKLDTQQIERALTKITFSPMTPIMPKIDISTTFLFPSLEFAGSWSSIFGRSTTGRRPRTRYGPSLEALDRMIFGNISKALTGLELRPIPRRRRRK